MTAADHELIRRCRRGEARAWEALVRSSTPLVYRLALRMLRDAGLADDATQEVFLRMVRSFDSYDATRAFEPWLCRIAYHVCVRRLQGTTRRELNGATDELSEEYQGQLTDIVEGAPADPESAAAHREAVAMLEQGFAQLTPQDRGLLTLRYREGLSDAEVAEATQMAVNTVKSRIFRARAQLARHVRSSLGGDEP